MDVKNVLVTGESVFIRRHNTLFGELASYYDSLSFLPRELEWYETPLFKKVIKAFYAIRLGSKTFAHSAFQKNAGAFRDKTSRLTSQIKNLDVRPDLVFHLFGTYSPYSSTLGIPYVTYLDWTSALSERSWKPWSASTSTQKRLQWLACERWNYQHARHIFTFSELVKDSLIHDYGKKPEAITVVRASHSYSTSPPPLSKAVESESRKPIILFNGSDFERKGGDIVLEAFELIRQHYRTAKLVIVGTKLSNDPDSVSSLGSIDRDSLKKLFLEASLIITPARCEPFATFVLDSMSFGVPCITGHNRGNNGIAEIIDHGRNGILVEPNDVDAIAQWAVKLLLSPSLLSEMSREAQATVMALSWKDIANTIADVILEI